MTATLTTADISATDVGGSLYVIEIGADRIKVGWSGNPALRLRSHRAAARAYGVGAGREWVSATVAEPAAETTLIDFCAERATQQVAREFFIGVRFEDAVEHAVALTTGATMGAGVPLVTPPTGVTWLTAGGVAEHTDRHVTTIRLAAVRDELHGHQPMLNGRPVRGGKWAFHPAAVNAWVRGLDERAQAVACGCAPAARRGRAR